MIEGAWRQRLVQVFALMTRMVRQSSTSAVALNVTIIAGGKSFRARAERGKFSDRRRDHQSRESPPRLVDWRPVSGTTEA
jgi:hypothetical protein